MCVCLFVCVGMCMCVCIRWCVCVCCMYQRHKHYCLIQRRSYSSEVPLQANTYPLVGRAVFPQKTNNDLVLLTLRPVALSSDGQALSLMLHRYIGHFTEYLNPG